jgi:hypothetical protein
VALQINAAGTTTKLVFDGSASPLSAGTGPYTIFARVRRDTDTGGREWLVSLGNGGAYTGFSVAGSDSFTKFDWNQGDVTLATATVGTWMNLAQVVTAGNLCTAYDGTSSTLTSASAAANLGSALQLLTIGVYPFSNAEYGRFTIDDLRVWSAALSQAELESEAESATPVRTSNLWDTWEFASGSLLASTSGTKNLTATGSDYAFAAGPLDGSGSSVARLAAYYRMLRSA